MEGSSSSTARNGDDHQVDLPDAQGGAASMLVHKVAEMLASYLENVQLFVTCPPVFVELCTTMAKAIDYAIANNEVPIRSRFLAPLLIQVYQARDNDAYLIGLMMLTMSVQCACQLQWFTNEDTEALLQVCKEVMNIYSDPDSVQIGPRDSLSWLSEVTSRYYPSMKIDHMLFSVLIQPGCRFCVASIPITKNTVSPGRDKISLFAIQVDNLEMPSCAFTPPEVNILINGNDIKGRTTFSLDESQLPTDVTVLLKPGVNCLQAFGKFEGDLLVVIAVTSSTEQCFSIFGSQLAVSDSISRSAPNNSGQTPEKQTRDLLNLQTLSGGESSTDSSSPILNPPSIDEEDYDQEDLVPDNVTKELLAERGSDNIPINNQDHQESMDCMMQSSMADGNDHHHNHQNEEQQLRLQNSEPAALRSTRASSMAEAGKAAYGEFLIQPKEMQLLPPDRQPLNHFNDQGPISSLAAPSQVPSPKPVPNPVNHFPVGVDPSSDISPINPNPLEAEDNHQVKPDDFR